MNAMTNIINSPYLRPLTMPAIPDYSTILVKDFHQGLEKRKAFIHRLQVASSDGSTPLPLLKKMLLELRQTTLSVIEDALEIEYRAKQAGGNKPLQQRSIRSHHSRLPPLSNFRAMKLKDELLGLAEIIDDVEVLFKIQSVKAMLPRAFPEKRNPFMLNKTVDELAVLHPPQPDAGDMEEELKVLELLRYKRAAKALLRAEAQLSNRLVIDIHDVEALILKMADDPNIECMLRAVSTLLDNDQISIRQDADLSSLSKPIFHLEAHEFLLRLNAFRGNQPMRINVQVAVRQKLRQHHFDHLEDAASRYLLDWMDLILNTAKQPADDTRSFSQSSHVPSKRMALTSPPRNIISSPATGDRPRQRLHTPPEKRSASPSRPLSTPIAAEIGPRDSLYTHEKITVEEKPRRKMELREIATSPPPSHTPSPSVSPLKRTARRKSVVSMKSRGKGSKAVESKEDLGLGEDKEDSASSLGGSEEEQSVDQRKRGLKTIHERNQGSLSSGDGVSLDSRVAPSAVRKRLRTEIQKAIRVLGLTKPSEDEEQAPDKDLVQSLRYELTKMQQELLRRNILDPHHYVVNSVDEVTHARHGYAVPNAYGAAANNAARRKRVEQEETRSAMTLVEKKNVRIELVAGEIEAQLSVGFDSRMAMGEITISMQDAYRCRYIHVPPAETASTYLLTSMFVSKLMYSRISGDLLYDDLLRAGPEQRNRYLRTVMEKLERLAESKPLVLGRVPVPADRLLFTTNVIGQYVMADIHIYRNDVCDGLVLQCTPTTGGHLPNMSMTPVYVYLHDCELEVLLINQRSLFLQALVRWSSMMLLAQWLVTRVEVKRSFAHVSFQEKDKKDSLAVSASPAAAIMPRSPADGEEKSGSRQIGDEVDEEEDAESKEQSTVASSKQTGKLKPKTKPFTLPMVEVLINRTVEVSATLSQQWKASGLPALMGLDATLTLTQDLEVLVITVTLTIPSKRDYRSLVIDANNAGKDIDMDLLSDDGKYTVEDDESATFALQYRLTRAELIIFGHTSMVENRRTSISSLSTTSQTHQHPENLMWNVFSRLRVNFTGSTKNPYKVSASVTDAANWMITYTRSLCRDVRTVSEQILMITVSAVGQELLLEPEPLQSSADLQVNSKRVSEMELQELVHAEGLAEKLLQYEQRHQLAVVLLDKLKLVATQENRFQLELATFVETKLIMIIRSATEDDPEEELGTIEINPHHTLSDLRVMMKHEIELDALPTQFRFLYKGIPCSIRQESFRRAWECLPKCYILGRVSEKVDAGMETEDIMTKRLLAKINAPAEDAGVAKLLRGQRRMNGKFAPVPVYTLCTVHEGKAEIYLLHDGKDLLIPGDIIRIGNVRGRDYIVKAIGSRTIDHKLDTKVIHIEPEYDLLSEPDFMFPIQHNFSWPNKLAGMHTDAISGKRRRILKTSEQFALQYDLPDDTKAVLARMEATTSKRKQQTVNVSAIRSSMMSNLAETWDSPAVAKASLATIEEDNAVAPAPAAAVSTGDRIMYVSSPKRGKKDTGPRAFTDCWIWKCIAAKDDNRPKWRQLYDDGEVHYHYEMTDSKEYFEHFRVKAMYSYLEVLCTDSRCPTLTIHHQRIHEMRNIQMDFYTKLAFEKITEWNPVSKKGIDKAKYLKLMKDVTAFPDLKRTQRITQLEALFYKVVKSEFGVNQKFINYAGFCYLLRATAVLRFPPKNKNNPNDIDKKLNKDSTTAPPLFDDSASLMTDDVSSVDGSVTNSAANSESVPSALPPLKRSHTKLLDERRQSKTLQRGISSMLLNNRKQSVTSSNRTASETTSKGDSALVLDVLQGVDHNHVNAVYQRFVLDVIMTHSNWYDAPWHEAKLSAMKREAVLYCAATRLAAMFRGFAAHQRYRFFVHQLIALQSHVRRRLAARRVREYVYELHRDWCFRQRYHAATCIQALIRRFVKRCWFENVLIQVRKQQIVLMKARRQRLKKLREPLRKAKIYAEAKRINGVMVVIKLLRKDPRNYTKNYGINIEVYVPMTQATFRFSLEDAELREYMALELEVPVVTVGDLLDIRKLKRLMASRLIVTKAANKKALPVVTFSKHALGQRGEKTLTRGKRIDNELFVCRLFETVEDIAIQSYHRLSCKVFTCKMTMTEIREWVTEHYRMEHVHDEMAQASEPEILHPKNKAALHLWLLNHLAIDRRKGNFKVLFAYQVSKNRKRAMIIKIQAFWRRALARPIAVKLLDEIMVKVHVSATDHTVYYLNRLTGASSWEKPKLLLRADLPTPPYSHWVSVNYYDEATLQYYTHYVNPYTGRYTHLSVEHAAKIVQAAVRKHLMKLLRMPLDDLRRAVAIHLSASTKYHSTFPPRRLAIVINHALVQQIVELQETYAQELYREAVELSEANPLVTRAYAIFLIGTCEAPMVLNRERAFVLLADAQRKDPECLKFDTACLLYHYACLRSPRDVRTLLNLALVQCLVYGKARHASAERLFRRALAMQPFDERVMEMWNLLKDRFPERQLLYYSAARSRRKESLNANAELAKASLPTKSVYSEDLQQFLSHGGKTERINGLRVVHGRPVQEHPSWAGWCFVAKDVRGVSQRFPNLPYWYNPADGAEQVEMPDFAAEWQKRRLRSQYEGNEYGLDIYFDPLTAAYFQYHALTDTYE